MRNSPVHLGGPRGPRGASAAGRSWCVGLSRRSAYARVRRDRRSLDACSRAHERSFSRRARSRVVPALGGRERDELDAAWRCCAALPRAPGTTGLRARSRRACSHGLDLECHDAPSSLPAHVAPGPAERLPPIPGLCRSRCGLLVGQTGPLVQPNVHPSTENPSRFDDAPRHEHRARIRPPDTSSTQFIRSSEARRDVPPAGIHRKPGPTLISTATARPRSAGMHKERNGTWN